MTEQPSPEQLAQLRTALRRLMLPISPDLEDTALVAASEDLQEEGIASEDWGSWVNSRVDAWQVSPTDGPQSLLSLIQEALTAGLPDYGTALGRGFVRLHQRLLDDFNQPTVWALVSQAGFVASVVSESRWSAAQVAKILALQTELGAIHWEHVKAILRALGIRAPAVTAEMVGQLASGDSDRVDSRFSDASLREGSTILHSIAKDLGFRGDFASLMDAVMEPVIRPDKHVAYAQILQFQAVIAEFWDHPLTVAYEFSPRGVAPAAIFRSWPEEHRAAASPMLNNAKAVYALSPDWAKGKKVTERPSALALVAILQGMESMPFMARRELASWIRAWLIRTAELLRPLDRAVPEITAERARRVLAAVGRAPTLTRGIIEQRVLDAIAVVQHPPGEGWRGRGVGDSVFAPNFYRRKLGDCDFQRPDMRLAVAYEAHGGRMSETYLADHLSTLARVLPLRLEEWEGIADPADWTLQVVVVAHSHTSLAGGDPIDRAQYSGVNVEVLLKTFSEVIEGIPDVAEWLDIFERHVHVALSRPTTREDVYQKYLAMLGD